jgi:excisionase family DNA binding protein
MDLLTTSELAAAIGLSPPSVRALAARGRIPSHPTPGGHHRVALDEVRAALEREGGNAPLSLGALRQRRADIHRVARRHGARNVRVVGSVARGEQRSGSDVDLLVDLEPGRSLFDVAGLHDDLEQLLGLPVDVVTSGAVRGRLSILAEEAVPL